MRNLRSSLIFNTGPRHLVTFFFMTVRYNMVQLIVILFCIAETIQFLPLFLSEIFLHWTIQAKIESVPSLGSGMNGFYPPPQKIFSYG